MKQEPQHTTDLLDGGWPSERGVGRQQPSIPLVGRYVPAYLRHSIPLPFLACLPALLASCVQYIPPLTLALQSECLPSLR